MAEKQFRLTAKETEAIRKLLKNKIFTLRNSLHEWRGRHDIIESHFQYEIDTYLPILQKIKKWQDEY